MEIEALFLYIMEIIGTIAFAISGIRLAAYKHFDIFGAYTVGLVTAIGGGTLRDVLLNLPVFWLQTPVYLAVTAFSLIIVIVFRKVLVSHNRILFTFDAVGLALFVVIGMQKTLEAGYPMWGAIVMGTVTGSFGGVVRDILINEEPLFFRKDIYATACVAGGVIYWLIGFLDCSELFQQIACAITVISLRVCALKYNWALPVLSYDLRKKK
ncbi:MAG: trimeric intracellular cation channel family protein [Muribaculaceae bacterium]|nr:trimeric intracellular cation channel family protein [Muribaculaceae bacterium]